LAEGFHRGGAEAKELPIADGGEGTAEVLGARVQVRVRVSDAFGRQREAPIRALPDGTAVVEAAEAIPLDPLRLDPLAASSRGLGELIAEVEAERLLVCLGGTANVDGGAGLREVLRELPRRRRSCAMRSCRFATLPCASRLRKGPRRSRSSCWSAGSPR
jgi:glycerate kinase